MKDLQLYFSQAKLFLDSCNINYGYIENISVNSTAKHRWGQARRVWRDNNWKYSITISDKLLQESISDIALMNTLIHEILHTVDGCFSHTGKWKMLADRITKTSEYTIKRTCDWKENGLEEPKGKYTLKCEGCGQVIHRDRISNLVKYPQRYRCGVCGSKIVRC